MYSTSDVVAFAVQILVWKQVDFGGMSDVEKEALVAEVNLLRELRHTNIVRYYDRIIDRENTRLYIVMEYCDGGDLAAQIKRAKKTRFVISSKNHAN
jgi:NIMA (never in mitosis gene a)-related kinase 2